VQILDQIDNAVSSGEVVYVHCWGAVGRTGTVVDCYLVRHEMTGKQALAEIARLRKGTPDGWKTSPETDVQQPLVRAVIRAQLRHGYRVVCDGRAREAGRGL
jgi:protein-tyrosine phosphatase